MAGFVRFRRLKHGLGFLAGFFALGAVAAVAGNYGAMMIQEYGKDIDNPALFWANIGGGDVGKLSIGAGCANVGGALTCTGGGGGVSGFILDPREVQFPSASGSTIAAGGYDAILYTPWTGAGSTISSVVYLTTGTSPSFGLSIQINGVNVTGCSGLTVTSATVTVATCTGLNAIPVGSHVVIVISSPSGTIIDPMIQVVFSHTAT